MVTVMPELLTSIWLLVLSSVVYVNELEVLVDTGFRTPPIEKDTFVAAAKLLFWKPFDTVILLLEIDHEMVVWNPSIPAHEDAAVVVSGIVTWDGISTVTKPF